MNEKVSKFMPALCLFVLFLICIYEIPVSASSADIRIYSDAKEYHIGDSISVYIEIEADTLPGDFEGSIVFPDNLLKYTSESSLITAEGGVLHIYDHVTKADRKTRKYAFRFKAIDSGNVTISLIGPKREEGGDYDDDPELYELEDGYRMSISRNELEFSIVLPKNVSKDANLAILRVSPGTITPDFSPDITEYLTVVSESTEKLSVSAAASDREAKVSISGNENLQYGDNKIEIKVTAVSGDVKKYYIYCKKNLKENGNAEENGPENGPEHEDIPKDNNENSPGADKLQAKDTENGIKLVLNNEFYIAELDGFDTPEGYKKTSLKIDGISIPVFVSEKNDPDSFILILLKDKNGDRVLYDYDRKDKTLQKHIETDNKDQTVKKVMTDSIEALELAAGYDKSLSTLTLIIAGLSALTMALMIIVIRLAVKNKKDDLD